MGRERRGGSARLACLTALVCLGVGVPPGWPVLAGEVVILEGTGTAGVPVAVEPSGGVTVIGKTPVQTGIDRAKSYSGAPHSAGADVVVIDPMAPATVPTSAESNARVLETNRARAQDYVSPSKSQGKPPTVVILAPDDPQAVVNQPRTNAANLSRNRNKAKSYSSGGVTPQPGQTVIVVPGGAATAGGAGPMSNAARLESNTDKAKAWLGEDSQRRPCTSATASIGVIGDVAVDLGRGSSSSAVGVNNAAIGGCR
ncbi:MAG: hypothetical protein ABT940_05630 [Alphaproteobacteria bacterium]